MSLRPVHDQLAACLALSSPQPAQVVPLRESAGRVLAESITSPISLPAFDNSAMDGYAVHVSDVAAASREHPVTLAVVDDLPAGRFRGEPFEPGTTVRIMTGAPIPPGTGAVVQVEHTDAGTELVQVFEPVHAGQHLRAAGEDVTAGELVLEQGSELTASRIGLLAAIGVSEVAVRVKPRVLVLATGSELVAPGGTLAPGQIYESNGHLLTAAVAEAGGVPVQPPIVPDEPDALRATLREHLDDVDLVVTSGGVSAGAYDTVKEVLAATGSVVFTKVAMQPGMPQGCGTVASASGRQVPIITLPGNPVSTFVSFEVFARPVLRSMLGLAKLERPVLAATAERGWASPRGKEQYARVRLTLTGGVPTVTPVGGQRSHLVADLASSNALAIVPPEVTQVQAGDSVACLLLRCE